MKSATQERYWPDRLRSWTRGLQTDHTQTCWHDGTDFGQPWPDWTDFVKKICQTEQTLVQTIVQTIGQTEQALGQNAVHVVGRNRPVLG